MKENNTVSKARVRKQDIQRCILAILLVLSLVLAGLVLNTCPVYAPGGAGPDMLDPGEGGNLYPHTVEGQVKNRLTADFIEGLTVYIYYGAQMFQTTTDVHGSFRFQGNWIHPNSGYGITVNGRDYDMGVTTDDMHWGQWMGIIPTDNIGYGFKYIYLEPSRIVDVTAAALFSNTKYATLSYQMTGSYTFSHSMSFDVANSFIEVGYSTSKSVEYSFQFKTDPLKQSRISKRYYASTYWNDIFGGQIVKTGIVGAEQNWDWDFLQTEEYLNPYNLANHKEHRIAPVGSATYYFTETGSHTWSASSGVPFAIIYPAYDVTIKLDTTVTASASTSVQYVIDRSGDTNPNTLTFWAYTQGTILDTDNHRGGFELHVWDMSGAG